MDGISAAAAAAASPTCEKAAQYLTTTRASFETLLWIATIAAYVPQYLSIIHEGTRGISPYYILNHGLFSTTTLALRLSHNVYFTAFNCVVSGRLWGWRGYSAYLGFWVVTVQWLCSVVLLLVYTRHRTSGQQPDQGPIRPLSDWQGEDFHAHKLTSRRMLTMLACYAAAILPVSLSLLSFNAHPYFQEEPGHTIIYVVFWSVWVGGLCVADAFLVVFQFIKQMKTVGRLRTRGSLSIVSLGLQSVVLIGLSLSQFFRSRRNLALHRERSMGFGRFLRLFGYLYSAVSVDAMYLVAGLGYLVLFQLCLLFDWNQLFGRRFGRIQLL